MRSLTGLELYLFERSGLIIRRSAVPEPAQESPCPAPDAAEPWLGALRDSELLLAIQDLLGNTASLDPVPFGAASVFGPDWRRLDGPSPDVPDDDQVVLLACLRPRIILRVATHSCAALEVLPGTHVLAPAERQKLTLVNRLAEVPGAVRLRLAKGDAAIMSSALIARAREEEACACIHFIAGSE